MRLMAHNMLSCNIKGVTNGFPLLIEAVTVTEKEVDFNPDFLKHMLPKIEWKALVAGARSMGYAELPEDAPSTTVLDSDEPFLRKLHHALLELHLEEGALVCPETGRKFPVNKGIPNMLLHEDEMIPRVMTLLTAVNLCRIAQEAPNLFHTGLQTEANHVTSFKDMTTSVSAIADYGACEF